MRAARSARATDPRKHVSAECVPSRYSAERPVGRRKLLPLTSPQAILAGWRGCADNGIGAGSAPRGDPGRAVAQFHRLLPIAAGSLRPPASAQITCAGTAEHGGTADDELLRARCRDPCAFVESTIALITFTVGLAL
jgi:hypothetical protein